MKQADFLEREINGENQLWFSPDYLRKQIERAYQAGLSAGFRVKLHAMVPINNDSLTNLENKFWENVYTEYKKRFENDEVWVISQNNVKIDHNLRSSWDNLKYFLDNYEKLSV